MEDLRQPTIELQDEHERQMVARFDALQARYELLVAQRAAHGEPQSVYVFDPHTRQSVYVTIGVYEEQLPDGAEGEADIALAAHWGHTPGAADMFDVYISRAVVPTLTANPRSEETLELLELSADHVEHHAGTS
ncbi:hypothetical protein H7Y63_03520 [Polaromonas sp.]|nr:hypothetical protein [Candidatus Saccharibacteria bacterium]